MADDQPNFTAARVHGWSLDSGGTDVPVYGTFDVADVLGPAIEGGPVLMPPDGWPDVVVITFRSLTILRNTQVWTVSDPNTGLIFHRTLSMPNIEHTDVRLADMNDDRRRDIVTTATDGNVRIYYNNNNGTFGVITGQYSPDAPGPSALFDMQTGTLTMNSTAGVVLRDIDGDVAGVREILVAGSMPSGSDPRPAVGVAFRPGDGWPLSGDPDVDIYQSLTLNTRCIDLLAGPFKSTSYINNTLPDFAGTFDPTKLIDGMTFGMNSGSGGVFSPVSFTTSFGVRSPTITTSVFRPAQPYQDFVQVGLNEETQNYYLLPLANNGQGELSHGTIVSINSQTQGGFVNSITSGSFTADGFHDVAVACAGHGTFQSLTANGVLVYRGNGNLSFTGPFALQTDPTDGPTHIETSDVNRNCVQDLLTVMFGNHEVRVYLNLQPMSCE